jgi:alkane 1-monooxygenase
MTRARPSLHDDSVGFLLSYAIPGIVISSVWLGPASGYPNAVMLIPLCVGYVLVPVLQDLAPRRARPVPEGIASSRSWRWYYRVLPLLAVPPQLAMLAATTAYWSSGPLSPWGRALLLVTTGVFSTMFAINIAHELIHRRQRFDRSMGGVLLSTVGFGAFKVVHLKIHHRYVGTPRDFATATRGQSIYSFWIQNFVGNVREALRCERARLARAGRPAWRSELVVWYGLSAAWLALAIALWGWTGGLFFLLQSVIAIMKLDVINYLQHYGLTRRVDGEGRWEPVQPHHAWSQGLVLHDLLLLNLPRHSDHHVNPRRSFESLSDREDAPHYPWNYAIMTVLLLVPPLFRRVAHPALDRGRQGAAGLQRVPSQPA